jgi:photosystem II stability/assembly factor-like uncharacterized protein
MTQEERELRRALEARSGEVTPQFRARLSSALTEGRPASNFLPALPALPALAAVAAVVLVFATVGVLLLARQARNHPPPVAANTPTASATPTPTAIPTATPVAGVVAGVLTKPPGRIDLPAGAQLSAPSRYVIWALMVDQYLYRSTDRGATWKQEPLPPPQGHLPQPELSFVSDADGWVIRGGSSVAQLDPCGIQATAVWHTTDAGTTWQLLPSKGIAASDCKSGLSFVDSSRGFLGAWDRNHPAIIYRTSDGGQTWTASQPLPDPPGFKTVCSGCIGIQTGPVRAFGSTLLVSAWQPSDPGTQYVFSSIDGGATWTYAASPPRQDGNVDFVTATRWLELIGPGQSKETTDAGATWHAFASDYSQAAPIAADFVFADSQVGYGTVRGEISRTADGGLHWVQIKSPGT